METIDELFTIMDQDKEGILNYQEFKNGFKKLIVITRIRNVIKEINNEKNELNKNVDELKLKLDKINK